MKNDKNFFAKVIHFILMKMVLCCWCLLSMNSFAGEKGLKPLPAMQAFVFSLDFAKENKNGLMASWQIAPRYYLYRERLHLEFIPPIHASIHFPKAMIKKDFAGATYQAYAGHLKIPITFNTETQSFRLKVDYQGCSSDGFCYPVIHKDMQINLSNRSITELIQEKSSTSETLSLRHLLTHQQGVATLLNDKHFGALWLIFTLLGVLLGLTPCVLPMIPILMGIIVGQEQRVSTKKAFFLSLSYVLGGAVSYALAGFFAAEIGHSVQVFLQIPAVILLVSGLFFLLALSLFGFYELRLSSRLQNRVATLSHKQKGGYYASVFLMGAISTLMVSPCVTAPLVGVLIYVGQTGDKWLGMSLLFAMGLGMGLPLLLMGSSAGKWLPKSGPWMEIIKKIFGVLMVAMAVWLASRVIPLLDLTKLISTHEAPEIAQSFTRVHDLTEFNKELLLAQAEKKPIMLDFYAEWCESCVIMDKKVFSSPYIQQALNKYILLRIDLSANTLADEEFLKYFNVIAPPTILFFNAEGKELSEKRIVGEMNANEFLARL